MVLATTASIIIHPFQARPSASPVASSAHPRLPSLVQRSPSPPPQPSSMTSPTTATGTMGSYRVQHSSRRSSASDPVDHLAHAQEAAAASATTSSSVSASSPSPAPSSAATEAAAAVPTAGTMPTQTSIHRSSPSTSTSCLHAHNNPRLFKIEISTTGESKCISPVFYPGDLIQGMVHLYLDQPMTMPALKIVFRGESNYPTSKSQEHLDHHMRRLFSVAQTLWGAREAQPEESWGQLPAGDHIFPFTVQLPDKNLPASFDHPWLKNQYTLTAYYRRPNGLSKWQSKAKPINFMPLSAPGLEQDPIQECCPKMGTTLLVSQPDATPGGRVHVKLTAGASIDRCQFALSRHIRAKINDTMYKEDEVICHYERKAIPKGELSLVLPLPKTTPPTTESSAALQITYSVQVSIWNERFFFKTESHNFDFPIKIRTLSSCDNRACEGLDWCTTMDRPTFLTEIPMQPLPLYESDQSPPEYYLALPLYSCASASVSPQDTTATSAEDGSISATTAAEATSTTESIPSTNAFSSAASSSLSLPLQVTSQEHSDQQNDLGDYSISINNHHHHHHHHHHPSQHHDAHSFGNSNNTSNNSTTNNTTHKTNSIIVVASCQDPTHHHHPRHFQISTSPTDESLNASMSLSGIGHLNNNNDTNDSRLAMVDILQVDTVIEPM